MCDNEVINWEYIEKINWKTESLIHTELTDADIWNMAKRTSVGKDFESWVEKKAEELIDVLANYYSCMYGSNYKHPGDDFTDMIYHIIGCGHHEYDSCMSTPALADMLYLAGVTRYKKGFRKVVNLLKKN